ncbi:polycystic kidney disease 1 like 1 [Astyanax mexicanus]|uniref:polycystic kidney disease 1 like 1 n=1 Tax=Astyanax mexicanus TaxID=7994 RepID=UPI0020CB5900|nr:polycystic kidney disease 1 like 1 [Astyanax mexicanus]
MLQILFTAVCTSLWRGQQDCFFQSSNVDEPITELLKYNQQSELCFNTHLKSSTHHQPEITHFEKVLVARQRARYLRLARPPTLAERKCLKNQIKRRTLINKAIRKMVLFMVTLLIAGFIAYGKSSTGATHLNQVVRTWFSRDLYRPLYSTQKPDTWWNWTENTLLYGLYQNNNMSYNGIENNTAQMFRFSEIIHRPSLCGKFGCYKGEEFHFYVGKNRSEMSNKLQKLKATNWVDANTKAMMVQFTLYSPPYNLFTTVSVLGERTPIAAVQPSVFIHSTRLYGLDTALDYWLMAAELLFLLLTLLQLYVQLCALTQRGWLYWVNLWNWLEVRAHMMTLLISVLGFICTVYHFTLRTAVVDHLQREDFKKFVDISSASSWEQISRSLYGVLVFLLLMKSCFVLSINEAMPAAVSAMSMIFSNLLWPLIAGLILVIAFSCMGNLFFHSDFHVFSSLPRSMYWITSHCLRLGKSNKFHKQTLLFH